LFRRIEEGGFDYMDKIIEISTIYYYVTGNPFNPEKEGGTDR